MAGQTPIPLPRVLTHRSSQPPELITQGAEGLLYKTFYLQPSLPCALKHRPPKPYRHPILDARLTRQRILAEARILAKARREGVPVPGVYCVDEAAGWMMIEWVAGQPVRARVNAWLGDKTEAEVLREGEGEGDGGGGNADLVALMRRVGAAVGALHAAGIVHGDLTTSNMMLRPASGSGGGDNGDQGSVLGGEIVIIDFGLASQGQSEEDRAVDLYVLERAFLSTHPRTENLFGEVLAGYARAFKGSKPVLRKLEDVRMRGRKRSMLG
ncbi:putative serine threonine-protein kinase bud32 [Diaporthe ampelina]|uniref:EKC/KEOPS complex subunit BUD32 n=1 Tax=Diaporthe ampelina TaxID=1214573 RepID=A0A0G2FJK8_9PEZI|nr:putative serine threonine-protein kinase bud32 [Diaporthe ampelina]